MVRPNKVEDGDISPKVNKHCESAQEIQAAHPINKLLSCAQNHIVSPKILKINPASRIFRVYVTINMIISQYFDFRPLSQATSKS